jgi:hypothetical protein
MASPAVAAGTVVSPAAGTVVSPAAGTVVSPTAVVESVGAAVESVGAAVVSVPPATVVDEPPVQSKSVVGAPPSLGTVVKALFFTRVDSGAESDDPPPPQAARVAETARTAVAAVTVRKSDVRVMESPVVRVGGTLVPLAVNVSAPLTGADRVTPP